METHQFLKKKKIFGRPHDPICWLSAMERTRQSIHRKGLKEAITLSGLCFGFGQGTPGISLELFPGCFVSPRTHIGISLQSNIYEFVRGLLDSVIRDIVIHDKLGENSGSSLLGRKKPDLSRLYVVKFWQICVKWTFAPKRSRWVGHIRICFCFHLTLLLTPLVKPPTSPDDMRRNIRMQNINNASAFNQSSPLSKQIGLAATNGSEIINSVKENTKAFQTAIARSTNSRKPIRWA